MGPFAASVILLVVSAVRAFQYTELAQYVDSHQEEYVEVNQILASWQITSVPFHMDMSLGFALGSARLGCG